jgi:alpha-1,6-mannosyltransferase
VCLDRSAGKASLGGRVFIPSPSATPPPREGGPLEYRLSRASSRAPERIAYGIAVVLGVWICVASLAWRIPSGLHRGSTFAFVPSPGLWVRRGAGYAGIIALYAFWLWRSFAGPAAHPRRATSFKNLALVALPALGLAFAAYPTTTDVYTYLHSARMWIGGHNPYLVPAGDATSEFSPFIVWHQASTYGPVSQLIFGIAALFTGVSLTTAVYAYKALCLAAHVANGYGIWRLLADSRWRTTLTTAYLLCPALLFEQVAEGHIEVFLISATLVLFGALSRDRVVLASCALLVGTLIKIVPAVWAPLLAVFLVRQRRFREVAAALTIAAVLLTACTLLFLPRLSAWKNLMNPAVSWNAWGSFHYILLCIVQALGRVLPDVNPYRVLRFFKLGSQVLYAGWYFALLRKVYIRGDGDPRRLRLVMTWSVLLLFLLATPWYMPWYATLLVPMVVLTLGRTSSEEDKTLAWAALVYSFASASHYILSPPGGSRLGFCLATVITILPTVAILARGHAKALVRTVA